DVDDDRHAPALPDRCHVADQGLDADVLQADRVEHATSRLDDAQLRVAGAWPQRQALAGDTAEPLDVEDPGELQPVAEAAGGRHHRVGQGQAALAARGEVYAEVHIGIISALLYGAATPRRKNPPRRPIGEGDESLCALA